MIGIVGPTATGKTAVGVELAERLGGEIISADSMQIWRGMDIGTAKPTAEERLRVPFHLVDIADVQGSFSAALFGRLAKEAASDILARGKIPILVGGTGLYVRALVDDLRPPPRAAKGIRERLQSGLDRLGPEPMMARLREVDPATAARLSPADSKRIVRALEVFETTNRPLSEFIEEDRRRRRESPWRLFGLACDRDALNERISQRVDAMIEAGWVAEVRSLAQAGMRVGLQSACALGYQEILAHVRGDLPLSDCVLEIKRNTRRYAKRQRTWFRADGRISWIDVTAASAAEAAVTVMEALASAGALVGAHGTGAVGVEEVRENR